MHPLDGPRFKIRRAVSQIETLRKADTDFRALADYRVIVAEPNSKGTEYALRALINVLPPPDLGLCIGEIAHQLRSALDGLVYQLERLRYPAPKAGTRVRTQFPIFERRRIKGCREQGGKKRCNGPKPRHFVCNGGPEMIERLCPCHQRAIKRLQPYQRGTKGKRNPLYLLQELNNADKHRLLQTVGGKAMGYGVGGVWGDEPMPDYWISTRKVLEDGAQVGRVSAIYVDKRQVRMEQEIFPAIAFWEGCEAVAGSGVCFTLLQIAEHVSKIVESFGPEFG
jgi:hypothetical protein